jgi:hypothetical protein
MMISGGSAALVVLATCLLLIQSGNRREIVPTPANPASIVAEASGPAALRVPPPAYAAASPASPQTTDIPSPAAPIQVSVPQLAYAYLLGYRLPGPAIADAQQAHLALCQRLGTARCQLVSMRHGNSDEAYANANLELRVASDVAQSFRAELTRAVATAGGRPTETSITAEDVSKDLVDTEARIRQREILVARLTDMLRNRQGRVSELVEAERSVAGAQEELDQAKGWLRQLRTRVALSQFRINYVPAVAVEPSPRAQTGRLSDAVMASAGMVLAIGRNLLILLIFLTPWALIGLAGTLFARRWFRRRSRIAAEA